jgi:Domain of unknown function (DUF1707)
MATGFNIRVGDADREAVASQLREHYADGRLTLDELNERLDQAFAAKTRADLNTVLRDLPHAPWPGAGGPGRAMQPSGTGWDRGNRDQGNAGWPRGPFAAFAPVMGLVWLFIIIGSVFLFGMGGGDRPIAIALIIAALALLRRLFGMGRRRGYGGPCGPRGRRRRFLLLPRPGSAPGRAGLSWK